MDIQDRQKTLDRWAELAKLPKRALVVEYRRMQRARGIRTIKGGPVTRQEYLSAILMLERQDAGQEAHRRRHGDDHQRCPSMDWQFICDKPEKY